MSEKTQEVLTERDLACYHCGEPCEDRSIHTDEKIFCCEGCKLVYELLDENNLCTYYDLDQQPGISFKNLRSQSRFDYLEDEETVRRLVEFTDGSITKITFHIPSMHCASCIWLLENLHKLREDVLDSKVQFMRRELSVTYRNGDTTLRELVELLASIGYEPEIHLDRLEKRDSKQTDRRLWLKLGLAGFSFGNIMLFSFPEYLSDGPLDPKFRTLFGVLNIALALPVLLYSASDYLKSAWAALKQRGVNLDVPISIGILALFSWSLFEIISDSGVGYMDSFTGLVFFLLIGKMVQQKTYERLSFDRDFRSYFPISVIRLEEGEERSVTVDKLQPGHRILIRNQELIPADSVLLSAEAQVDYSFVTGEAEPVEVNSGDTVYAGGRILGNAARMDVVKEVSNSYLTRLWNDAAFHPEQEARRITTFGDRISTHFTATVISAAMLAGLFWLPTGVDMAITTFTAVLIVACPCALALSSPFTLSAAINVLARNGFFVKSTDVMETLARSTAVVLDKTGTLTSTRKADIQFSGAPLSSQEQQWLSSALRQSIHPLSRKLSAWLSGEKPLEPSYFEEEVSRGVQAVIDGHMILLGSSRLLRQFNVEMPDTEDRPEGSVVYVAIDQAYRGVFELQSTFREGLESLIGQLRMRFKLFVLSGDNDREKHRLLPLFRDEDALRFNQKPQEKLNFIRRLQHNEERVLMIGDGLNDAGALKQSDFGISITEEISAFSPACDAIMQADALPLLNRFIDFSQRSMHIILYSFGLSLVYNLTGLSFAVTGHLSPLVAAILMPLSSLTIMGFTTLATHLTAKKMGLSAWK